MANRVLYAQFILALAARDDNAVLHPKSHPIPKSTIPKVHVFVKSTKQWQAPTDGVRSNRCINGRDERRRVLQSLYIVDVTGAHRVPEPLQMSSEPVFPRNTIFHRELAPFLQKLG
jgi:hypothetical protein